MEGKEPEEDQNTESPETVVTVIIVLLRVQFIWRIKLDIFFSFISTNSN